MESGHLSQKKSRSFVAIIVIVALVAFVAGILGSAVMYSFVMKKYVQVIPEQRETIVNHITQLQDETIIDVVADTTASVVSIVATRDVPKYQRLFNSPSDFFMTPPQETPQQRQLFEKQKVGGGTGFFVSSDGNIVTNKHVVVDSDAEYTIITSDGREYQAMVIARDDILDFAVLKIEGDNFQAANLGNSDEVQIGQTVIAIGNSLGEFSHSVSRGIISGMQRDVVANSGNSTEHLTDIIQTDAAINFGNSGGPLLDLEGNVVGINTAVAQGAENIGFAIPINQITKLIEDVKTIGKILRPFLGVRYIEMTSEIKEELNFPYDNGILIVRGQDITDFAVLPGSPADEVGLTEYDIIMEIDGEKITSDKTLAHFISNRNIGDTIILKIWREGKQMDITVVLKERLTLN